MFSFGEPRLLITQVSPRPASTGTPIEHALL
jgi:hypothetical protein